MKLEEELEVAKSEVTELKGQLEVKTARWRSFLRLTNSVDFAEASPPGEFYWK